KAGGGYVPLDPSYPPDRLAFMLEDSAPVALLTDAASIGCLPSPATMAVCRLDQADPPWQHQPASALDPRAIGLSSRNLAYVIYTSGSTGTPKGVTIEHRNAVSLLHWANRAFASEDRASMLFSTSLSFDLSVYEWLVALSSGTRIYLVADALELITAARPVSLINTVPSALTALLDADAVPPSARVINLA